MTQIALATTGMLGGPGSRRHVSVVTVMNSDCRWWSHRVAVHWSDEPFYDEYLQLHMPAGFDGLLPGACRPLGQ
jgi:hypothetical protein